MACANATVAHPLGARLRDWKRIEGNVDRGCKNQIEFAEENSNEALYILMLLWRAKNAIPNFPAVGKVLQANRAGGKQPFTSEFLPSPVRILNNFVFVQKGKVVKYTLKICQRLCKIYNGNRCASILVNTVIQTKHTSCKCFLKF